MNGRSKQAKVAAALEDVRREADVLGAAFDASDRITFFLDKDDEAARSACERWGVSHRTSVLVKVIGRVVI